MGYCNASNEIKAAAARPTWDQHALVWQTSEPTHQCYQRWWHPRGGELTPCTVYSNVQVCSSPSSLCFLQTRTWLTSQRSGAFQSENKPYHLKDRQYDAEKPRSPSRSPQAGSPGATVRCSPVDPALHGLTPEERDAYDIQQVPLSFTACLLFQPFPSLPTTLGRAQAKQAGERRTKQSELVVLNRKGLGYKQIEEGGIPKVAAGPSEAEL